MSTQLNDIISGCINNDRRSQEKLYRQFYPALFALCKQFFDDDHEVLTSINNGMIRVFKNIGQYDYTKGDFFNWVYTVVRNTALTGLRDKKIFNPLSLDEALIIEDRDDLFTENVRTKVQEYMQQLPVATRAVGSLHYLENYSVKEISATLAISEGTVKWHLSETRNRLKNAINKNNY